MLKTKIVILGVGLLMGLIAPVGAFAEEARTFIVTAYYSPLPCQDRYVTGSYEGDIRLNGRGVAAANGTAVYPGMIAAPKSYAFGTKIYLPGIGMTTVHDRGGAIVDSGVRNNAYDRLDVWMGYGDKGLQRALNWGKRTVDGKMYGVDPSIMDEVSLGDYSPDEAVANDCAVVEEEPVVVVKEEPKVAEVVVVEEPKVVLASTGQSSKVDEELFNVDLFLGMSGADVRRLQEELRNLNLFRTEESGYYGEVTENAVFKFQQIMGVVSERDDFGAGVFGPKTRKAMNELILERRNNLIKIAAATAEFHGATGVRIAGF